MKIDSSPNCEQCVCVYRGHCIEQWFLVTSQSKSNEHTLSLHIKIDSNFEWFPVFHGSCCCENGNSDVSYSISTRFFFLSLVYAWNALKSVAFECSTAEKEGKKIVFYIRCSTHWVCLASNRLSLCGTSNFIASFFMITYILFSYATDCAIQIVSL